MFAAKVLFLRFLRGEVVLVLLDYLCYSLFSVVSGLYLILPLYFFNVFHTSRAQATFMVSAYLVGRALGIVSYVRFARICMIKRLFCQSVERLILIVSAVIVAVLLLFISPEVNYKVLLILMLAIGFITSVFPSLNLAILNSYTYNQNQIKYSSLQRWFQNIGMLILFITFWWSGHSVYVFKILAMMLFVAILVECCLMCYPRPVNKQCDDTKPRRVCGTDLKQLHFYILSFVSLVVFMQMPNLYAYYLNDTYHITASRFSAFMVLNCILVIALQIPLSKFVLMHMSRHHSACIGMLAIACGAVLPLVSMPGIIYVSFVVWTLGEMFLFTAIKAYLMVYSSDDSAHNMAITTRYYTIFYLSNLVCPVVIKYLYERITPSVLLILLSLTAIAVAFSWLFCGAAAKARAVS